MTSNCIIKKLCPYFMIMKIQKSANTMSHFLIKSFHLIYWWVRLIRQTIIFLNKNPLFLREQSVIFALLNIIFQDVVIWIVFITTTKNIISCYHKPLVGERIHLIFCYFIVLRRPTYTYDLNVIIPLPFGCYVSGLSSLGFVMLLPFPLIEV